MFNTALINEVGTFGRFFDYACCNAGLTANEVASKLSVTTSAVNQWRENRTKPRRDKLHKIGVLLDVDENLLLKKYW